MALDLATLGYEVDTSGLAKGEAALDSFAEKNRKTSTTAKEAEGAVRTLGGVAEKASRSYDELRASVDPAFAATQAYASVQRELAAMVASGGATQSQANLVLEQAASKYMGVSTAAQVAAQAERDRVQAVAAANQAQAEALQRTTTSYQSLRASIDPLYAASMRYANSLQILDAALQAGIISQQQFTDMNQRAAASMLTLEGQIRSASGAMGAHTGNIAAQFNDIGVMAVAGQSPMILAIQQGTQLSQVFNQMTASGQKIGPALLASFRMVLNPISLVTIAVIAGGAALYQWLTSASDAEAASKALEKTVEGLQSSMQAYQSSQESVIQTSAALSEKFGQNATHARELHTLLMDIAKLEFLSGFSKSLTAAQTAFAGIEAEIKKLTLLSEAAVGDTTKMSSAYGQLQEELKDLNKEYGLSYGQAVDLNRIIGEMGKADGIQEQAIAAKELVEFFVAAQAAGARIPPEVQAMVKELGSAAMMGLEMANSIEGGTNAAYDGAAAASNLASHIGQATGMAAQLVSVLGQVPAAIAGLAGQVDAAVGALAKQNAALSYQVNQGVSASAANIKVLRDEAVESALASGMSIDAAAAMGAEFDKQAAAAEGYSKDNEAMNKTLQETAKAATGAGKAAGGAGKAKKAAGGAASKAAKDIKRLNDQLDTSAERWREQLSPVTAYTEKVSELQKLQGRLSSGEMAAAMKELNVEFADSLPLVGDLTDTLVEGLFNGFKGTLDSIKDIFKSWLSQMISMAIKNQIVVSMGVSATGGDALTQALNGALGGGGKSGGGLFSGLFGGLAKSFSSGLKGVFSGITAGFKSGGIFGALGGGISSSIGGITSGLAAGGLSGIAGAIGSAIPVIGAIVGLISVGKKLFGRTLKDTGVKAAFSFAEGVVGETYKFYKGGLFRSNKTKYSAMEDEMSSALNATFKGMYTTVEGYAKTLGLSTKGLKDISASFKFSTKDMSEEDIQARFEQEMLKYGDALANAAANSTLDVTKQLQKKMVTKNLGGSIAATMAQALKGGMDEFKRFMQARARENMGLSSLSEETADKKSNPLNPMGMVSKNMGAASATTEKAVNVLDKYKKAGESSVQVLERLATSLSTVNASMDLLGLKLFNISLEGGAAASRLVEMMGGLENFTQASSFYYDNFYTDQEKLLKLNQTIGKTLRETFPKQNLKMPKSIEEFRKLMDSMEGYPKGIAALLQIAPLFKEMLSLRDAAQQARDQEAAARNQERDGLLRQYYELTGQTAQIRALELKGLDASNHALQRRIWALQDEQEVMNQRKGLEGTLLQLQGDTGKLRQLELANLAPANRELQIRIWRLEDEKRVMDERRGIETQYYQLVGNTAELRKRELAALAPANRALQQWLWNLTDATERVSEAEAALKNSISTRQQEIADLRSRSEAIRGLASEALAAVSEVSEGERKRALDQIRFATMTGRVWDSNLDALAEKASKLDSTNFRSARDYLLASAQTAAALSGLADKQEQVAETEEARLERLLSQYGLREETVKSLDEAIRDLNLALGSRDWLAGRAPLHGLREAGQSGEVSEDTKKLQETLQTIQAENRQLLIQVSENTRKVKQMADEWNAIGMPTRTV